MKSIDKNDSDEVRTRVTAVKGRCLNRLTTEPGIVPFNVTSNNRRITSSSPSRARTYNITVNSRALYH